MYSEIASNKRKTWFIMAAFIVLIAGIGYVFSLYLGHPLITPFVLVGALIYAVISYYAGSSMALALNGAKEIQKSDSPRLWRIVENLSIAEGLPMPRVFIMDDPAPNAFATGRNPEHAAVCATTGILDIMDDTELEGVFAHELGHVKNYDIRVSMITFALVSIIGVLCDIILHMTWFRSNDNRGSNNQVFLIIGIAAAVLAPLVATLIQLAISRRREYLADATGALTTRYPEGLASALEKISAYGGSLKKQNTSTAHLFFANPLKKGSFASLFSTHPPIEERVRRLREMGKRA
jgi:heat shock protein HtpX